MTDAEQAWHQDIEAIRKEYAKPSWSHDSGAYLAAIGTVLERIDELEADLSAAEAVCNRFACMDRVCKGRCPECNRCDECVAVEHLETWRARKEKA